MKNKTIKWIGIILAALVASAFLIFAYMIGDGTFKGTMQLSSNEDTAFGEKYIEYLSKYGINLDQFFSSYTHEKIRIESSLDGHNIPAERFLADGRRDNDTLILVHGMGGNRQSVYPMAELFLKNGFNALVYDQRSAGENTAEYTTFGYWESRDLSDAVRYLKAGCERRTPYWSLGRVIWRRNGGNLSGIRGIQSAAFLCDFGKPG